MYTFLFSDFGLQCDQYMFSWDS